MKYAQLHVLSALLLLSLVILPSGCSKSATQGAANGSAGSSGASPSGEPPALVRVETMTLKEVRPEFRAMGNVKASEVSVVASGADGIVAAFNVEVGDYVTTDPEIVLSQLRIESTDRELAQQRAILAERQAELEEIRVPRKEDKDEAQARKQSAEVTYVNAARRLAEVRALSERGAATPTEVKDTEDLLRTAEQNRLVAVAILEKVSHPRPEAVFQAEFRVEAQKQHVEFLEAEKNKRTTRPPFNGYVVEEHTNVGQWLSKGDPIVTLAALDEVDVEVQVDQSYVDQIAAGQTVRLSVLGAGSQDGRASVWTEKVSAVVPRSRWREGSRSFPVIIRIRNNFDENTKPFTPFLREGMMAEAIFEGKSVNAIMVPKVSLLPTQDDPRIFVVNSPVEGQSLRSVRQVTVKPGLSDGLWIQVSGEDLQPGMLVVTEGVERLRPSATIQILESEETSREP